MREKGLNQSQVAERLFMTTAGVHYILKGQTALTVDKIQRFEELFQEQIISVI